MYGEIDVGWGNLGNDSRSRMRHCIVWMMRNRSQCCRRKMLKVSKMWKINRWMLRKLSIKERLLRVLSLWRKHRSKFKQTPLNNLNNYQPSQKSFLSKNRQSLYNNSTSNSLPKTACQHRQYSNANLPTKNVPNTSHRAKLTNPKLSVQARSRKLHGIIGQYGLWRCLNIVLGNCWCSEQYSYACLAAIEAPKSIVKGQSSTTEWSAVTKRVYDQKWYLVEGQKQADWAVKVVDDIFPILG